MKKMENLKDLMIDLEVGMIIQVEIIILIEKIINKNNFLCFYIFIFIKITQKF